MDPVLSTEHIKMLRLAVKLVADKIDAKGEAERRFIARIALDAFAAGFVEPEQIARIAAQVIGNERPKRAFEQGMT